ncbi:hypothetical protein RB195_009236 [Necator americanus]|uniref:Uncharacterized protein n=1 Tax=Necator americanus TaxID=51031 RepID=A0ABR1CTN2_NECAM
MKIDSVVRSGEDAKTGLCFVRSWRHGSVQIVVGSQNDMMPENVSGTLEATRRLNGCYRGWTTATTVDTSGAGNPPSFLECGRFLTPSS